VRLRRFSPTLAFLAGVVGVALFGLLAVLVPGDDATPPANDPVPALDDGDIETLDWTAVDELPTDHVVHSVTEGPHGWLAISSRFVNSTGGDYLLLNSSDGVSWTQIGSGSFPAAVSVDSIVGHASGYIAYGLYAGDNFSATTVNRPSNFAEPAVWTSLDGAQWELVPLPLPTPDEAISEIVSYGAFDLATDGDRFIALGYEFDEDLPDVEGTVVVPTRVIMWEAQQPGEWHLVQPDGLEVWTDLASGSAGIVATTRSDAGVSVVSWIDGRWTETGAIPGDGGEAILVGGEHGYLTRSSSGILYSADASNWTTVDGPSNRAIIGAGSGGFAVVGRGEEGANAWWSADGTSWTVVGSGVETGADLEYAIGAGVTKNAVLVFGQDTSSADVEDARGFLLVGTKP
jgi:hypothetical protein